MLKRYSFKVKLLAMITVMFILPYLLGVFSVNLFVKVRFSSQNMITFYSGNGDCAVSHSFYFSTSELDANEILKTDWVEIHKLNFELEDNWNLLRFEYFDFELFNYYGIRFPWYLLIILPGFLCWFFHRRDKKSEKIPAEDEISEC